MGRSSVWTDERIGQLVEEYATRGPKVLAAEFGTTPIAVVAKARRLGLPSTRKRPPDGFVWTEEMLEAIRTRYTEESGQPLADEFGISLHTVRKKAHSMGLRTNQGHVRWGKERAANNGSYDLKFFDSWTPDMAYTLGFLFADGCIDKRLKSVRVLIASRDRSVLEFIHTNLKAKTPIKDYEGLIDERTGRLNRPQSLLVISSEVIVSSLLKLGMFHRKTYNDDPFPEVPDDMLAHFVRGYLDGDGCVSISHGSCMLSFVGSTRFIRGLKDGLVRLLGVADKKVSTVAGKKADYSNVYWSSIQDIRKLRDFLYPTGEEFCLSRKRDKLVAFLSENEDYEPGRRRRGRHTNGADSKETSVT